MRNLLSFAVVITIYSGSCAIALADGGQIRFRQNLGGHQLTVFTSPTPLRAGPIDVSVLLQDAASGRTVSDANITIELTPADPSIPPIRALATAGAATNKLLRAALVELPAPGEWHVRVQCTTPDSSSLLTAAFTLDAAEPLPRWIAVWPWFTWPIAAVALFAVHRTLVARRIQPA